MYGCAAEVSDGGVLLGPERGSTEMSDDRVARVDALVAGRRVLTRRR
jgi:hypothetical protein